MHFFLFFLMFCCLANNYSLSIMCHGEDILCFGEYVSGMAILKGPACVHPINCLESNHPYHKRSPQGTTVYC